VNLVSLDARPEDRATWAAITIAAAPVAQLGGDELSARVIADLEWSVDGGGASTQFEVPRLATINVPAGFVRVRAQLVDGVTPWQVTAQISQIGAGQKDARARISTRRDVEKNDTLVVPIAYACTDAEALVNDNSIQAGLNVEGVFEGLGPDGAVIAQRAALYGAPCTLPAVAPISQWRITSQIAGSVTLVQYLGP